MSEALNLVDDQRPERLEAAYALLDEVERAAPRPDAGRIGVTGAPGAGKSTLLDALVRAYRSRGETLGIVAVDPSSLASGGALLGDRIRVRSGASDPGVFFRSMAARDRLGGVSDATRASVVLLAAVFDRVFVETVGVGQSEADVASLVDSLVYVVQPGAGDILQFMKAGLLELPDVFAVNKCDLGASAERTAAELSAGLGLSEAAASGWRARVVPISARDGLGIDDLLEALDAHARHLAASGELAQRRRRARELHVIDALERRYGSYGVERAGGRAALAARARDDSARSSFALIRELGREIEDALRKPGAGRGRGKAR